MCTTAVMPDPPRGHRIHKPTMARPHAMTEVWPMTCSHWPGQPLIFRMAQRREVRLKGCQQQSREVKHIPVLIGPWTAGTYLTTENCPPVLLPTENNQGKPHPATSAAQGLLSAPEHPTPQLPSVRAPLQQGQPAASLSPPGAVLTSAHPCWCPWP